MAFCAACNEKFAASDAFSAAVFALIVAIWIVVEVSSFELLPVLIALAIAERDGLSGRDLLVALAAGFEAVDGWFKTTASDMARDASRDDADTGTWWERWERGGFDMVEKFDDRVQLFATRLSAGTHEFSYVVRATTAGTFTAAGASAELMYQPEAFGRTAVATVVIR